jgi:hypothetical protein
MVDLFGIAGGRRWAATRATHDLQPYCLRLADPSIEHARSVIYLSGMLSAVRHYFQKLLKNRQATDGMFSEVALP